GTSAGASFSPSPSRKSRADVRDLPQARFASWRPHRWKMGLILQLALVAAVNAQGLVESNPRFGSGPVDNRRNDQDDVLDLLRLGAVSSEEMSEDWDLGEKREPTLASDFGFRAEAREDDRLTELEVHDGL